MSIDLLADAIPDERPAEYRYAIHDLRTRVQLAHHIPFNFDQPIANMLPEAGRTEVSLKMSDDRIRKLDIKGTVLPRRSTLVVLRNELVIWEGVILNRRYESKSRRARFSVISIRDYVTRRLLRPTAGYGSRKDLSFTLIDQLQIFRDLVADMQAVTRGGEAVGDIGLELDDTVMSGVLRDRRDTTEEAGAYHGYEFASYGSRLDELADVTNGFEWRIDTQLAGNLVRRRVVLGYPRVGLPADHPGLVALEYPGNIIDYDWPEDGERSANYVAALGSGEGLSMRWGEAYNDVELDAGWPLWETTISRKSLGDPDALEEAAGAELARRTGDIVVPSLRVAGYPNVQPGDHVRLRIADESWFPGSSTAAMETTVRVVGIELTPQPREQVSLIIEEPRDTGGEEA